jgi:arylsulfatase A-like enzyme
VPRREAIERFGADMPPAFDYDRADALPPPHEVAQAELAYESEVAYVDERVGMLLDSLRRDGSLQNTVVLITADHGEQFGEHGIVVHGNSLYMQLLHVPLVVVYPGRVPAGLRVAEAVTLRDLPATVLDIAGLADSARLPGVSLARRWSGAAPDGSALTSPVVSQLVTAPNSKDWRPPGTMSSLVDGRFHYILNADGSEELYDIVDDGEEARNLAGEDRGALERMRRLLEANLGHTGPAD